jgi:hypothetical protein
VQDGTVGSAGAALVTNVVGTGSGALDSTGAVPLPLPFQTAGPGTGYVVAFLAASESMLNAIPGSVALYAPGNDTRYEDAGDAVPEPLTTHCEHSG